MTAAAIIREAAADGVSLALSPAGTIKATGDQVVMNRTYMDVGLRGGTG
jgi:hypothetical protein